MLPRIYTVGHSSLPLDKLVELLDEHHIDLVADIRSHPMSRNNPQFDREALERSLQTRYTWLPQLGGPTYGEYGGARFPKHHIGRDRPELAKVTKSERPKTWWNVGLYEYGLWMAEPTFTDGLHRLEALAADKRVAIMCAEALWWKCHRSMVADAWEALGGEVYHIMWGQLKRHILGDRLDRYEDVTRRLWTPKREVPDGRTDDVQQQ